MPAFSRLLTVQRPDAEGKVRVRLRMRSPDGTVNTVGYAQRTVDQLAEMNARLQQQEGIEVWWEVFPPLESVAPVAGT